MAELKTKPTRASVAAFIGKIADEGRRDDCLAVLRIMKKVTRKEPQMWGPSIVGFGSYRYKYASGREGDWPPVSFAPRKQDLTVYLMCGMEHHAALLAKLGKHTMGKSCLHIKKLADVDLKVLEQLIAASVKGIERAKA